MSKPCQINPSVSEFNIFKAWRKEVGNEIYDWTSTTCKRKCTVSCSKDEKLGFISELTGVDTL